MHGLEGTITPQGTRVVRAQHGRLRRDKSPAEHGEKAAHPAILDTIER